MTCAGRPKQLHSGVAALKALSAAKHPGNHAGSTAERSPPLYPPDLSAASSSARRRRVSADWDEFTRRPGGSKKEPSRRGRTKLRAIEWHGISKNTMNTACSPDRMFAKVWGQEDSHCEGSRACCCHTRDGSLIGMLTQKTDGDPHILHILHTTHHLDGRGLKSGTGPSRVGAVQGPPKRGRSDLI